MTATAEVAGRHGGRHREPGDCRTGRGQRGRGGRPSNWPGPGRRPRTRRPGRELCPRRRVGGDAETTGIDVLGRAGQRARATPSSGPTRAARCCSASPSTLWRPPIWAAAPACGGAASSRRSARAQREDRRPDRLGLGWGGRPATSPTSTWPRLYAELSTRLGWATTKIELPPGGTRPCCRRAPSPTC